DDPLRRIVLCHNTQHPLPRGSPKTGHRGSLQNRPTITIIQDVDFDARRLPSVDVSNVLNEEKKQQVIALGRLGWSLRKIQKTTGVRRETAAEYLRAAGIGLRPPGAWGRSAPAKRANEVTADPGMAKPATRAELTPDH